LVKAADDSDAQVRVAVLMALTDIALAHRGEAAAKDEAKKAALALADKMAQSNPIEAAEAKKKLTEPLVKKGPAPMRSPGL
jgi:sensor histidine kinase regulating citrate/malate metabolism